MTTNMYGPKCSKYGKCFKFDTCSTGGTYNVQTADHQVTANNQGL